MFSPIIILLLLIMTVDRLIGLELGPLFIYEKRVSKGKVFNLIKLNMFRERHRKRYIETSEEYRQWATYAFLQQHQENLTPFGRIMKRFYLDELGQLINILTGDMSFVGPCPLPVGYEPGDLARREQKAGLVGFTATRWKNAEPVDAKQADMEYLTLYRNATAVELMKIDIKILFDAMRTVAKGKGL